MDKLGEWLDDLTDLVAEADEAYRTEMVPQAQATLGDLYDASHYLDSLVGAWQLDWEFPSTEPPDYLRRSHPEIWRQQEARIAERFDQAVEMAEAAFTREFAELVGHLVERLAPQEVLEYTYTGPSPAALNHDLEAMREDHRLATER